MRVQPEQEQTGLGRPIPNEPARQQLRWRWAALGTAGRIASNLALRAPPASTRRECRLLFEIAARRASRLDIHQRQLDAASLQARGADRHVEVR